MIVLVVLAIGFVGVFYLHYQDMVKPIPDFDSLKQVAADGMKYTVSKHSFQYSFEFTDRNGKRFQTDYMEAQEAQTIKDALRRSPVMLFVGRWKSALKGDSIFTIYHMTTGDRILISYADIPAAKKKEQQVAIPVIAASFLLLVGIVAFVYRRRMQQALTTASSQPSSASPTSAVWRFPSRPL